MRHNLLLVDGDVRSLRVLEVSLRKAGFEVATATNGQEALDCIAAAKPDLIISETEMQGMTGFELCRQIKQKTEWGAVPFMFLTGQAAIENKIKGLELGVDEYLTKPIYIKEILTRIRILLQKQQRVSLETKRDTNTRFAGSLSDMGVVDLIQTVEVSRKSGLIHIHGGEQKQATIYFRQGRVVDAETANLQGDQAIYRLLTWQDGEFEVLFRTVRRKETIRASTQALLMEGMRRIDEWSRIADQLPPLDQRYEIDFPILSDLLSDLPDETNVFLRLFDGTRVGTEVVEASGLGDLEALEKIAELFSDGILFVSGFPHKVIKLERPAKGTTDTSASPASEEPDFGDIDSDDFGQDESSSSNISIPATTSSALVAAPISPQPTLESDKVLLEKSPPEKAVSASPPLDGPAAQSGQDDESPWAAKTDPGPHNPEAQPIGRIALRKKETIRGRPSPESELTGSAAQALNSSPTPVEAAASGAVVPGVLSNEAGPSNGPAGTLASAGSNLAAATANEGKSLPSARPPHENSGPPVPPPKSSDTASNSLAPNSSGVLLAIAENEESSEFSSDGEPTPLPPPEPWHGRAATVPPHSISSHGSSAATALGEVSVPPPPTAVSAEKSGRPAPRNSVQVPTVELPEPPEPSVIAEFSDNRAQTPTQELPKPVVAASDPATVRTNRSKAQHWKQWTVAAAVTLGGTAGFLAWQASRSPHREPAVAGSAPSENIPPQLPEPQQVEPVPSGNQDVPATPQRVENSDVNAPKPQKTPSNPTNGDEEAAGNLEDRSPDELLASARRAIRRGEPTAALATLEKVMAKKPTSAAMAVRVEALQAAGQNNVAWQESQKLVQNYPQFPDGWLTLGMIQYERKDYPAAKQSLSRYLELAPNGRRASSVRTLLGSL